MKYRLTIEPANKEYRKPMESEGEGWWVIKHDVYPRGSVLEGQDRWAREQHYDDVEKAKDKIRIVSQQIKDLQQRLPSKSDDIRNLSFIKDLANKVNLQSVDLKPEKEVMKEFYFLTRYKLNAEGTYLQFLLLLEQIARSQKLLNIPVIDIQLKQENQRGRFILLKGLIVVESYRYNEKYREESGIKDIEKKYNLKR